MKVRLPIREFQMRRNKSNNSVSPSTVEHKLFGVYRKRNGFSRWLKKRMYSFSLHSVHFACTCIHMRVNVMIWKQFINRAFPGTEIHKLQLNSPFTLYMWPGKRKRTLTVFRLTGKKKTDCKRKLNGCKRLPQAFKRIPRSFQRITKRVKRLGE